MPLPLKDDWITGESYAATAQNGIATQVNSLVRLGSVPALDVETVSTAATLSYVASETTTTISSGIEAANFGATAGKVSLLGCQAADLAVIITGYWAPAWKYGVGGLSPFGFDCWVTGSRYVEFSTGNAGAPFGFNAYVDGRRLSDTSIVPSVWAVAAVNTMKIDLGDTKVHRVRIMVTNMVLGKIWVEPAGLIWAAAETGPILAVLGDSLTGGTIMNTGYEEGSYLSRLANLLGIRNYWNAGIGSTSLNTVVTGPPARANFKTRATTQILPSNADIIIVGTYYTDLIVSGRTPAQIAADYTTVFNTLKTMATDPLIIAWGAIDPDPAGTDTADFTAADTAVRAACATAKVPFFTGTSNGEVVDAAGNVLLENGPWFTPELITAYIGSDALHPNDAGHRYLAYKIRDAVVAITGARQ